MINPFVPLTNPLLKAMVKKGKKYFVRQNFARGKQLLNENVKGYFIFTHYNEFAQAEHHLCKIEHDPNRYLYNWDKPEDQRRLLIAAGNPCGYKVYAGIFEKDWQKHFTARLKGNFRKYIDYHLGWRPGSSETVKAEISLNYGELYAKLKLHSLENEIKLEEI